MGDYDERVLAALVEVGGWARAADVGDVIHGEGHGVTYANRIGYAMIRLRNLGLVERDYWARGALYRPTPAGESATRDARARLLAPADRVGV